MTNNNNKQIQEGEQNDIIISHILADHVRRAREKVGLKSICHDLSIEVLQ